MIDGNMKNARTVCSVKNVGQIIFEGIGSVTVGKYNNLIKDLINRNNSALRYLKNKTIGWSFRSDHVGRSCYASCN